MMFSKTIVESIEKVHAEIYAKGEITTEEFYRLKEYLKE